MRVEILKPGASPAGARHPKDKVVVSDDEGRALIADGAAREIPPLPPPEPAGPSAAELEAATVTGSIETTVAPSAPERAVARGGKGVKQPRG